MKIIVINNGTGQIPLPDSTTLAAGASKTLTSRTFSEAQLLNSYASDNVFIRTELEAIDRSPLVATAKADASPTIDTHAGCGTQLKDEAGNDMSVQPQMYVGAFDDAVCATLAANATLDTAAAGTIDSGAGTNLLKVTPSATGEISLTLSDTTDEVVYVKCWPVGTDYTIDSSQKQTITFTT
jgi:hypothetical protein